MSKQDYQKALADLPPEIRAYVEGIGEPDSKTIAGVEMVMIWGMMGDVNHLYWTTFCPKSRDTDYKDDWHPYHAVANFVKILRKYPHLYMQNE